MVGPVFESDNPLLGRVWYILDDNQQPIPANVDTWRAWANDHSSRVAYTSLDNVDISTVLLSINHAFTLDFPPVLWETMVFTKGSRVESLYMRRYTSHADAVKGHEEIVKTRPWEEHA